jgi:1,4-dihydroxy-2-naphthoyl-CoA synthase
MTDPILTKVEGGVATLTLNRPKAMNSFDGDTARAIVNAVEAFAIDETVRTLVLASEGQSSPPAVTSTGCSPGRNSTPSPARSVPIR